MPIEIQEVVVEPGPASAATTPAPVEQPTTNPMSALPQWQRDVAVRRDRLRAD